MENIAIAALIVVIFTLIGLVFVAYSLLSEPEPLGWNYMETSTAISINNSQVETLVAATNDAVRTRVAATQNAATANASS